MDGGHVLGPSLQKNTLGYFYPVNYHDSSFVFCLIFLQFASSITFT